MVDHSVLLDQDRSLFLVQIRYLEEEVERYRLTCDGLEKQNGELVARHDELEREKREKTNHFKRLVAAKEKLLDELSEQLETRLLTAKRSRKSLGKERRLMKLGLQEQIKELQSEIEMQAVAVQENENLMEELKQKILETVFVEEELLKTKAEHEAMIHSLKINAEMDCEKLIQTFQDYKGHTESTKASERLATGRVWRDEQSEVASFLADEQSTLKEEIAALQRRQSHIRFIGRGLFGKIGHLSRLRSVNEKDLQLFKKTLLELREDKEECINDREATLTETEALSQLVGRAQEECRQKAAEVERLEEELEKQRMRRRQLEGVKEEAVIILRHILEGPEDVPEARWKIQRLVEILDRAALQGTGQTNNNPRRKARGRQKLHTSDPNSVRNEKPSGLVDPSEPTPQLLRSGKVSTEQ